MINQHPIYELRGKFRGKAHNEASKDIKYLQSFLSYMRRFGGDGFIWRL